MAGPARPSTIDGRRTYLVKRYSKLHGYFADNLKEQNNVNIRDVLLYPLKSVNNSNMISNKGKCRTEKQTKMHNLNKAFFAVTLVGILSAASMSIFLENRCIIKASYYYKEIKRPVVNCNMCKSLTEVPVETNLSPELFRTKYAHTSVPCLIKNATQGWTALDTFSFKYFKELYETTEWALEWHEGGCLQFMPYSTKFDSLGDFFNMSTDRANLKEGEERWYIGWMNCKETIKNALRQHYNRPYFLPNDTESSIIDWVFMGGPGKGVPFHIDIEDRPGWQAQVSGTKTWSLRPVPECEATCNPMEVTVNKGDIITLNVHDWYHSTHIEPGELSISIGSEYD